MENVIKDKISVIVPFLNAETTLLRCIESIRLQTYENLEVLLVDNGSTDSSGEIAEEASKQDSRVKVIFAEEKGVSAARNLGMTKAGGEFIAFTDADDLLFPTCLARLHGMMTKENADLTAIGFLSFMDEEKVQQAFSESKPGPSADRIYDSEAYIRERILHSDNHVWGKLYRKEFLDGIGASFEKDLTIGEDMLFLLHLTGGRMKAVCSEEKLYGYYVNPDGAIERPFTPSYLDQVRCWERAEDWIREHYPALLADTEAEAESAGARLISIRVVAQMLVASKLALLPAEKRRSYNNTILTMQKDVTTAVRSRAVRAELPPGYDAKTKLFGWSPAAYFMLYGKLKKK